MGGGSGGGGFGGTKGAGGGGETKSPGDKNPKYPGNNPSIPPGKGFEWRGRGKPESSKGNWYNPETGESWNPDLDHKPPIGPHWDYDDGTGKGYRVYPDGKIESKPR